MEYPTQGLLRIVNTSDADAMIWNHDTIILGRNPLGGFRDRMSQSYVRQTPLLQTTAMEVANGDDLYAAAE